MLKKQQKITKINQKNTILMSEKILVTLINKGMSQKRLAERCTYTVKEFPKSNLSKKAEEALNKIFSSMK